MDPISNTYRKILSEELNRFNWLFHQCFLFNWTNSTLERGWGMGSCLFFSCLCLPKSRNSLIFWVNKWLIGLTLNEGQITNITSLSLKIYIAPLESPSQIWKLAQSCNSGFKMFSKNLLNCLFQMILSDAPPGFWRSSQGGVRPRRTGGHAN